MNFLKNLNFSAIDSFFEGISIASVSTFILGVVVGVACILGIHFWCRKRSGTTQADELYKKLSEQIKYAVAPKFVELSLGVEDLVELALEIWRMEQRLNKCLPSLSENQCKGLSLSTDKLKRYLSKYDIELLDYTNQKFNDGLNLDVLSVEIDPSLADSIVKETIEPTVLCKGQVVRKAKIILLSNRE